MKPETKSTKDQTYRSFKDKWENNSGLAFDQTSNEESDVFKWIINRNGLNSGEHLRSHLAARKRILDAGCGNGRVTAMLHKYASSSAELVGIDLTAADVAKSNLKDYDRVKIYEKDLLEDLSKLGTFDFIYCQEVLHHTADPKQSFTNLANLLDENGEIAIYVYKLKAPLREFADDYIRKQVSELPYEDALTAMSEITEFGRTLSEWNTKIKVPKVEILGIEEGEYDLQRFIYHFFFKCYWNPTFNTKENEAINYDWYHPQIATRHTLEEVESWFNDCGLEIIHRFTDHYGITVRGIRR